MTRLRRFMKLRYCAAFLMMSLVVTSFVAACSTDETALGQIAPNQTVYADLWDEGGEKGDRALVEQKPSGLWVVDTSVHFRDKRGGEFDVKIYLDEDSGTFVVVDMGDTEVGEDHDDCLSVSEGSHEHYARMEDTTLVWEPDLGGDNDGDDCYVVADVD